MAIAVSQAAQTWPAASSARQGTAVRRTRTRSVQKSAPAGAARPVATDGEAVARVRPDPAAVRGVCPVCGEALVSLLRYTPEAGYRLTYECWSLAAGESKTTCRYRLEL